MVAALLLLRGLAGAYHSFRPSQAIDLIRWSEAEAVRGGAVAEGKPILYDFSAGWCLPCQKLQREIFADRQAARFINETFVTVRIDDANDGKEALILRKRYSVEALPTLIVAVPGGAAQRLEGYPGKRATMRFLRKAVSSRS